MCVAIVKPPNVDFPKALFEAAWRKNPHGGGYMYACNGAVVVKKGFMRLEDMMAEYERDLPLFGDSPVVLHFRIKTHGPIAPEQTHPHAINDRLAFVHNGIINIEIPPGSENSDTMEFRDRILQHLPEGFTRDPVTMELIRGYVGSGRLVFMDGDKNVTIVNERSGQVDPQGRWHSNEGAMAAVDPKYQIDDFYEILSARRDPDISNWKGLSKKARKALLREEKKRGVRRECRYCGAPLRYHDEADVCQQCMPVCRTCGERMPAELADLGSEICMKCMTDDERGEVEDLMVGSETEEFGRPLKEVVEEMAERVVALDEDWTEPSYYLDAKDRDPMMGAAKKGFTEFTAWFRDNLSDPAAYATLRQKLINSDRHRILFESGMERIVAGEEDSWEDTERNPPLVTNALCVNPETGKILMVS